MPIPQKLFFLVGRASCPSNKFMKRTFARGLMYIHTKVQQRPSLYSATPKSVIYSTARAG